MSFETVFEKWLQKQELKEDGGSAGREGWPQVGEMSSDDDGGVEEMPVIQREAWKEEDMEGMPVLQKITDLPSTQEDRKLGSPPPPPLQITLSLVEDYSKERQGKGSKNKSSSKGDGLNSDEKDEESWPLLQDISPLLEKSALPKVQVGGKQAESVDRLTCQLDPQDPALKEKALHQCQAKSALTELTHLNHITSPMAARGSEIDAVRSPEVDLPMEPDSTSEYMMASIRWLRVRKGSEASRGEASPWREVSPRSTGSAGLRTPGGSSSEVMVRIEESPAECDSTSMFMNSPSAISPASQGEIEERVYPVLADHEDGASPSHFVCPCRSLPPPSDLMNRHHTPLTSTAKSQLTVSVCGAVGCRSRPSLVSHVHNLDDDPAPDLEKVAPSLDLMATSGDGVQSDHDSPPVLTLPEQEARVKRFSIEHSHATNMSTDMTPHEAPPLIRYDPTPPQIDRGDVPACAKFSDSPPVLSSNDFHSQEKCYENPPVLSLHGQEVSSKLTKTKRQTDDDVCDFTSNIDWETAVVETVENPPHLTKYDGESKLGIILKIRTKGKSATSSLQSASKSELLPNVISIKRKRHTISSSERQAVDHVEVLPRLRKRFKSEVNESAAAFTPGKESQQVQPVGRKGVARQQKATPGNSRPRIGHRRLKNKTPRHSTVQLEEDLKVSTQDLTMKDSVFVLSSVELSRLQTLTRELVCVVFPRLQPHLTDIAPESKAFMGVIDDILVSLERSTSEEAGLGCEDLSRLFGELSLAGSRRVPVFSPQVVLCNSPQHDVEEFRRKVCSLFQLLLPDLTVSLTQTLSHSSAKLEVFLRKVIAANQARAAAKRAQLCA